MCVSVCKISVVQMFILKDIVYTCTGMKLKACFNRVARQAQWMFDFVSMVLKRFPFLDQSSFNVALKSIIQHKNWSWYTGLQSSIFPKWLNTISWNDKDILLVNQVIWMQSVALNFDSLNSDFGWVLKLYNTFFRSLIFALVVVIFKKILENGTRFLNILIFSAFQKDDLHQYIWYTRFAVLYYK